MLPESFSPCHFALVKKTTNKQRSEVEVKYLFLRGLVPLKQHHINSLKKKMHKTASFVSIPTWDATT